MCIANLEVVTFNLNRATSITMIATYSHSIRKRSEKNKWQTEGDMKLAKHRIFYIIKGRKIVVQNQYMFREKWLWPQYWLDASKEKDTVCFKTWNKWTKKNQ